MPITSWGRVRQGCRRYRPGCRCPAGRSDPRSGRTRRPVFASSSYATLVCKGPGLLQFSYATLLGSYPRALACRLLRGLTRRLLIRVNVLTVVERPREIAPCSPARATAWSACQTSGMVDPSLTGGCLCGGVRFVLSEPVRAAGYCHCTRCQRRTGTAASAQARINGRTLRVVQGEELVRGWRHPDGGFEKCFCGRCGAHLFSRNPQDPTQMSGRSASCSTRAYISPCSSQRGARTFAGQRRGR